MTVYFKEDTFIESKRSELYGWVNFLANCGGEFNKINVFFLFCIFSFSGFLGLLMGGSLISLVEIFYHFVLKRIYEKKRQATLKDDLESEFSKLRRTKRK